jgi:predicted XRE-type DNA-binding protein
VILKKRGLKQREIGKLLKIKQPEVSKLMNGRYTLFSQERLISFHNKLDQRITIKIAPRRKGERMQDVVFA